MKFITIKFIVFLIIAIPIIFSCRINPAAEEFEPTDITFEDANFEALLREILEIPDASITNYDLWSIKEIRAEDRSISSISGIEHCTGLHKLFLPNNQISNISHLIELVLLDSIDLSNNNITDLSPLIENTGIGIGDDYINVNNNPLNDNSIYQETTKLRARGVEVISNATPSAPGEVYFADANFENLIREIIAKPTEPINSAELATITEINGRGKEIENIYGIEYCGNIQSIELGENSISDLAPLKNLTELTDLRLEQNLIGDIKDISNIKNLTKLNLQNNLINDIALIINLTNLNSLNLSGNPITNFTPLRALENLTWLELNDIDDLNLNHIITLKNIQTLFASNSNISGFNLIYQMDNLENLFLSNCSLTDINPIGELKNLKRLFLKGNTIEDITPLEELLNLREIELGNNNISDILPLVNNSGLVGGDDYVLIYNNPLSAESLNDYIPQLQARGVTVIF